jgi:hypothetical protein
VRLHARIIVVLATALLVACGSSGGGRTLPDPGPSTGLDRTEPLSSLTSAQQMTLCTWVAGRIGGYGRRITCADGNYLTSESESKCMSDFGDGGLPCSETVATLEDCVDGVVPSCQALPSVCFNLLLDCSMFP